MYIMYMCSPLAYTHLESQVPMSQCPDTTEIVLKGCEIANSPIYCLTLKVPITTAADDFYKYFFIAFQRK